MKVEQEYYVIEKDGKMFGIEYEDGQCTSEGYIKPFSEYSTSVPMEKVRRICDRTKKYIDKDGLGVLTWGANKNRFLEQIGDGKLRKVRVTTTIEFID